MTNQQASLAPANTIVCAQCNTQNSDGRKFCGDCGDSLWVICPECKNDIAISEKFCGHCGFSLADKLSESAAQAKARWTAALQLAADDCLDKAAVELSLLISDPFAPADLAQRARDKQKQLRTRRQLVAQSSLQLLGDAKACLATGDFAGVVARLSEIPANMRNEEAVQLLADSQSKLDERKQLEERIEIACKGKATWNDLAIADKLLALNGEHNKAKLLGSKLSERACKIAQEHLLTAECAKALQVLAHVPARFQDDAYRELRSSIFDVYWMQQHVRQATHVDELLITCAERLQQKFPKTKVYATIAAEAAKRRDTSTGSALTLPKWAKSSERLHHGVPFDYFRLEEFVDGFEQFAQQRTPYAVDFAVATGLSLGGLEDAAYSLHLDARKRKRLSLEKFSLKRNKHSAAIGIEIGYDSIRAVHVARPIGQANSKPCVKQVVRIAFEKQLYLLDDAGHQTEIVQALRKLKDVIDLRQAPVVAGLPAALAFLRFVELPPFNKKQLAEGIRHEAAHLIPFPLDQVTWGHQLMSDQNKHRLFLMSGKRDQVERFLLNFELAEVPIARVQTEAISLANLADHVARQSGDQPDQLQPICLLSIGHRGSTFVSINSSEIYSRQLMTAGNQLTKTLAQRLRMTYEQAQQLKHAPHRNKFVSQVYEAVADDLTTLDQEIATTLAAVRRERPSLVPARVQCLGGGSLFSGLFRSLNLGPESLTGEGAR
jgi:Tfp pilus assembly PilM family ATPase